jgi:hypothetical protein
MVHLRKELRVRRKDGVGSSSSFDFGRACGMALVFALLSFCKLHYIRLCAVRTSCSAESLVKTLCCWKTVCLFVVPTPSL